jgi:hypothetical protein
MTSHSPHPRQGQSAPSKVRYFPLDRHRFELRAGLHILGTNFGNGEADTKVFQIDARFDRYRRSKLRARAERLSKYYQLRQYTPTVARQIARFITYRLAQEHAGYFSVEQVTGGGTVLNCALTSEALVFGTDMQLIEVEANSQVDPPYVSSLDALACQIQEDLAVLRAADQHWLSAMHLCFPNHWAAEEKIGRSFAEIHSPVPGIEKISARAAALVDAMIYKGPYVRFAWGISTDTHLNHHPQPRPDVPQHAWQGRTFSRTRPELWLRVERQTSWGFPQIAAALFTIHTYFTHCRQIRRDPSKLARLTCAIESMTPEILRYKGIADAKPEILRWLRSAEASTQK